MDEAYPTSDKRWWGPRIWRLLHTLAEVSDRADCGPAWRSTLKATAEVLPCAICKSHFHGHIAKAAFPVGPGVTAESMRTRMRRFLWAAHKSTGGGLAEADLVTEYGQGTREEIIQRARDLLREIADSFRRDHVLDRFHIGALSAWIHGVEALITLLRFPSPPHGLQRRRR